MRAIAAGMPIATDLPRVLDACFGTVPLVSRALGGGSSGLETLAMLVERYFCTVVMRQPRLGRYCLLTLPSS